MAHWVLEGMPGESYRQAVRMAACLGWMLTRRHSNWHREKLAEFGERAITRTSFLPHPAAANDDSWVGAGLMASCWTWDYLPCSWTPRKEVFPSRQRLHWTCASTRKERSRAADLVNHLDEVELADLLYRYGEEQKSRQVARAIVNARPIHTTTQLAQVVAQATQWR